MQRSAMIARSWKGAIVIPCYNEWLAIAPCGAPKSLHFEPWWPSQATHIDGVYIHICMHAWPSARFLTGDNSVVLKNGRLSLQHADASRILLYAVASFLPIPYVARIVTPIGFCETYVYYREKMFIVFFMTVWW